MNTTQKVLVTLLLVAFEEIKLIQTKRAIKQ